MAKEASASRLFKDVTTPPKDGLVVVYDLENFTNFLAVPDIQRHVSSYLNFVDAQVRTTFEGGKAIWHKKKRPLEPVASPIHEKFLGDGMMFIFDLSAAPPSDREFLVRDICNRALNTKFWFEANNDKALKFMPVASLPPRIRFGITYGTIHQLTRSDGNHEYVGFAINLAARLQKYAGGASFLASARLPVDPEWFAKTGYVRVRAPKLRNGDSEFVYIWKDDLEASMKNPNEKGLFAIVKD